jgi:peptidyl-prolyl cis-trans isomerase D
VRLTVQDFRREKANTEARLRQELGDAYDQLGADRYVDSQALNKLVTGVVMAAAARDLGLHVTKEELRRIVQASPSFIDEQGRFDPEAFDRYAVYNFGSQRLFIQSTTRDLLAQKLIVLLAGQTEVSDAEIDLRTRYEGEQVRIAYVALDPDVLPVGSEVTDEEVEAYAAANSDGLEALYASRAEQLAQPERVRARHILILVAENASEEIAEAARAQAKAARERLLNGESFDDVALEVSQDAGTATQGGDLGFFERGVNDPALDDTAFALEEGGLSEVVRSPYGFHILRVDEKLPAHTPSFEELREGLAREAAEAERALAIANETSAELARAVEAGTPLEDAVRAVGLTLERPSALRRRPDGFVPGLGAAKQVLTAAFAVEAGQSSPEIYAVGGQRVLIQVLEREGPSPAEIEIQRSSQRDRLLIEKQDRVVSAWVDDYRAQLEDSGRLRVNPELALGS